jgi:hypothetical protein
MHALWHIVSASSWRIARSRQRHLHREELEMGRRWITSRGIDGLPADRATMLTNVWFNLWTRRLRPYQELVDGDVVFFYDPPSRRVRWQTQATNIQRTTYVSKAAAARFLVFRP